MELLYLFSIDLFDMRGGVRTQSIGDWLLRETS